MIIDFHTHVFPDKMAAATIAHLEEKADLKAASNGTLSELLVSMEEASVDCSIIMPVVTAPRQFSGINRFAREINEQYGEVYENGVPKIISFGGIHPDSEDYKEQLKELRNMGFKGIKLHPDYQGINFDDIRYERIVEKAMELDMIVLVHAGIDIGIPEPVRCTPTMSAKVLKDTQAEKLVLAHLGGWMLWDDVEELLVGSQAILDMSFIHRYIKREQFYRIVKNHGSDKILFATDSPWAEQKETVDWLQGCDFPAEVKEKIFSQNALNLLGKDF